MNITRFAPSPTGPLHLGHAYSALFAFEQAKGGTFHLRIEDIDQTRARASWEALIYEDLAWLGLDWARPVMRQSDRMDAYAAALDRLWDRGLLYACSCKRRDIQAAAEAPQEGGTPLIGPDGIVYPGTCRTRGHPRSAGALRLNMRKAIAAFTEPLSYVEAGTKTDISPAEMITNIGDVVLARPQMGTSYHLSVVVDDAAQGITCVTRGADLQEATPIHVLLQHLLDLPTPSYIHHRLIRDAAGKRLAKRDDARSLKTLRDQGHTPQNIRETIGPL